MEKDQWDKILSSTPIDNQTAIVSGFNDNQDVDNLEVDEERKNLNRLLDKKMMCIEQVKQAARAMKKLDNKPYTTCLEIIAKQQGYPNYQKMNYQVATGQEKIDSKFKKIKIKMKRERRRHNA